MLTIRKVALCSTVVFVFVAPEAIFFIMALRHGALDFAIGALSGSVIVVTTVAVGVCYCIASRTLKPKTTVVNGPVSVQSRFLVLFSLIGVGSVLWQGFTLWYAVLGTFLYGVFIVQTLAPDVVFRVVSTVPLAGRVLGPLCNAADPLPNASQPNGYKDAENGGENGEKGESDEEEDNHELTDDEKRVYLRKGTLYLIVGASLIALFSDGMVDSLSEAAHAVGVNPGVAAFFVAPIASEAPEILGAIGMSYKGRAKLVTIALSNLIGGTVAKVTILLAVMCWFGVEGGDELKWNHDNMDHVVSFVAVLISSVFTGLLVALTSRGKLMYGVASLGLYCSIATTRLMYEG